MKKLLILSVLSASLLTAGESQNDNVKDFCTTGVKALGAGLLLKFGWDCFASGCESLVALYRGPRRIEADLEKAIEQAEMNELAGQMLSHTLSGKSSANRKMLINQYKPFVANAHKTLVDREKAGIVNRSMLSDIGREDCEYTEFAYKKLYGEEKAVEEALDWVAYSTIKDNARKVRELKAEKELCSADGKFYWTHAARAASEFGISAALATGVYMAFASKSYEK